MAVGSTTVCSPAPIKIGECQPGTRKRGDEQLHENDEDDELCEYQENRKTLANSAMHRDDLFQGERVSEFRRKNYAIAIEVEFD